MCDKLPITWVMAGPVSVHVNFKNADVTVVGSALIICAFCDVADRAINFAKARRRDFDDRADLSRFSCSRDTATARAGRNTSDLCAALDIDRGSSSRS